MDTRRFSARADIGSGATGPARRDVVAVRSLLDRTISLTAVNWEAIIFVSLMVLAIATRLIDLGSRAFHHDESIHAYYSNYYLHTGNYTTTEHFGGGYDPTYHGPFLYHITALMFLLFGTNDATARLGPALFGIALVGLCWLMRPFIGRIATVIAALLVIISPSIDYYSRSLRHDIFALFGLMLLFVSILWFMRTHQSKWVYFGAIGLIIAYASHELTDIVALIFILFLVLALFLYPQFAARANLDSRVLVGDEDVNPVKSAAVALWKRPWTLIGGALTFLAIYTVLYTNMLTKPQLILSGVVEGIRYWLSQQQVNRGTQPVWYYGMLMPIYEPLALIAGLATIVWLVVRWVRGRPDVRQSDDVDIVTPAPEDQYGIAYPSMAGMRGFTLAFLAFWSIGAFIAFSLAGERLPWLNMQIALPFTLLASAGLGSMLARVQWSEVRKGGGLFLGITVILFIFALFMFIANLTGGMPKPTDDASGIQEILRWVLLAVFTLGFLALSGWLAYKMVPHRAVAIVALTFSLVLVAYGIRSTALAVYAHGDVPVEMLIYTQSSPDVPIVMGLIDRLSRDETAFDSRNATDVTGGHSLAIFLDQNDAIEWPIDWYLRDMTALNYFDYFTTNPTTGASVEKPDAAKASLITANAPVIMVSEATENNTYFQNLIKGKYTTNKYPLNWWFPEETYKDNVTQPNGTVKQVGNLGKFFQWISGNGLKYILYRDPGMPLGTRNFYLHVRNDIAYKAGLAAPPAPITNTVGGPAAGMFDLAQGTGNGQFSLPRGITRDATGNFYVVDTGNFRVEKFDASGKFLLAFGSKGTGDGQFNPINDTGVGTGPGGIAVDKAGNIYVADTWNHRIDKFDSTGKFVTSWGSFISLADPAAASDPAANTKFYGPRGVAIGPDGNVYVTDTGNKRVSIFDPSGKYIRQITSNLTPDKITQNYPFSAPGEMNEPMGIVVDSAGKVYVADSHNNRVNVYDATGKSVAEWPMPAGSWDPNSSYMEPYMAMDSAGNLYVTAPSTQSVVEFNSAGQNIGVKKAQGAITVKTPTGITVGSDGTLYVVDTSSNGVVNFGKMP